MTFSKIEGIIEKRLPPSAYTYPAYWYDSKTHMLPKCWISNGYKMVYLNLTEQEVMFKKAGSKDSDEISNRVIQERNNEVKGTSCKKDQQVISIDAVLLGINKYYSALEGDENARYLSWEHCYKQFVKAHNQKSQTDEDIDYLSLHLAFYLASWGMLRGSSFLLQKDYKVHIDIVKELLKPYYNNLWGVRCIELQGHHNLDALMELAKRIKIIYGVKKKNIGKTDTAISDILVTKVLLGTLGCIPAYDKYFKRGIAAYNVTTGLLGRNSIKGLVEYYKINSIELEKIRRCISQTRQVEYPQMKILDMAFWQLGFDKK